MAVTVTLEDDVFAVAEALRRLEPSSRILQLWRTSEFKDSDEDSLLEVLFESAEYGTKIRIRHTQLPEHGMQYQQGWRDAYLTPMKAYFDTKSKPGAA